jgi:putative transposase
MTFDPTKRHRRSTRLRNYDYAQAGAYFLTLCSYNRECLFASIDQGRIHLSKIGEIVAQEWTRSAGIRGEIELDEWIVMPNHLHGIVMIVEAERAHGRAPLHRAPRSLSSFVAGFKAATTKRVNLFRGTPTTPVWQRNYYDHVIRNEASLNSIREYIAANPFRWADDEENPAKQQK